MSRTARQPIWWIALAVLYLVSHLLSMSMMLTEDMTPREYLSLPLNCCVTLGVVAFAFGFRFGSARFWMAVTVLYVVDWGPSLLGIIFRLARFAVNDQYVIYRSPGSYFVTIFYVVFALISLIRLNQSFERDKDLGAVFA